MVSQPNMTLPAVAIVPVQLPPAASTEQWVPPAEWFMVDRRDVIAALCGTPCRVGYTSPAGRVQNAFDSLMALIIFDQREVSAWRAALVGP